MLVLRSGLCFDYVSTTYAAAKPRAIHFEDTRRHTSVRF